MDLKVVVVLVCLSALAITSTEAGIPRCCIKLLKNVSPYVLLRVERWELQNSTGACDIKAALLYVRGLRKPICASPKVLSKLNRIRRSFQKRAA